MGLGLDSTETTGSPTVVLQLDTRTVPASLPENHLRLHGLVTAVAEDGLPQRRAMERRVGGRQAGSAAPARTWAVESPHPNSCKCPAIKQAACACAACSPVHNREVAAHGARHRRTAVLEALRGAMGKGGSPAVG